VFPEQETGQGGRTAWSAHFPDLNPLDFYLWRHLKSTAHVTEVNDIQGLQQVQNGFEVILTIPRIFQ
jgi:hypothetical protein